MKLHTVFVTYNRLELTKQAIASFLETVTLPFSAIVIDNDSTDGTAEWLRDERPFDFISFDVNKYPGYACNEGWSHAPADATHLQRADNDMAFIPGWCDEVRRMFGKPRLGQLGLRTGPEEYNVPHNTGGNCIIRADLWDQGLRWDDRPWPEFPPGVTEDSYFSPAVRKMGYVWMRVRKPCLISLATNDWNDPYYQKTFGDRRIKKGTLLTERFPRE